jgi:DNA adenine methylase
LALKEVTASRQPRRLIHFTPLRYPGGKGKLAAYVKELMKANRLLDGEYAEPYAGGAAIALELLFHGYVCRIHINDISRPVHAFWNSVLNQTDELCRLVLDTPLTVEEWDVQKHVLSNQAEHDDLDVGFAMFFLNRTNRSGILNGGIIGGRSQTGPWKIDARFNRSELVHRITALARLKSQINLTRRDALQFLKAGTARWPKNTLIYLDPPYYVKGRDLYYDFYQHQDHEEVAKFVTQRVTRQKWIVSYDDVQPIRDLYHRCQRMSYYIGYSARSARRGAEVMFFCDELKISPLVGAVSPLDECRLSA